RLQDLNYRVRAVTDPSTLAASARQEKPMLVLADLEARDICGAIGKLKQDPDTQHIPVIAFGPDTATALQESARSAGASVVASEAAILNHLPQFLEQALRVE